MGQTIWARAEPLERPTISVIILSVSPRTVRWATVHKAPDPGEDDPYYHVEVIEKERRTPPWQFKRLATHVVVTADALNRSRSRQKARTYFYKDRIPDRRPELARAASLREGGGCLPHDDPGMRRHRRQAWLIPRRHRKSRLQ
ncbi:UNVERIFIED_ORG: hypothetical protein GGE13_004337 [Rhizobium etli]